MLCLTYKKIKVEAKKKKITDVNNWLSRVDLRFESKDLNLSDEPEFLRFSCYRSHNRLRLFFIFFLSFNWNAFLNRRKILCKMYSMKFNWEITCLTSCLGEFEMWYSKIEWTDLIVSKVFSKCCIQNIYCLQNG